jgi:hypothetical protein
MAFEIMIMIGPFAFFFYPQEGFVNMTFCHYTMA